jgi:Domain of unknown function (DUF4062)
VSRKIKIFLSSNFDSLSTTRARLCKFIESLQLSAWSLGIVDVLELDAAAPVGPLEKSLARVRKSDVLVVVLSPSYGGVPSIKQGGDGQKSYVWLEVEEALECKIPVLAFVRDEDLDEHQQRFVQWLTEKVSYVKWNSETELEREVSRSLHSRPWKKMSRAAQLMLATILLVAVACVGGAGAVHATAARLTPSWASDFSEALNSKPTEPALLTRVAGVEFFVEIGDALADEHDSPAAFVHYEALAFGVHGFADPPQRKGSLDCAILRKACGATQEPGDDCIRKGGPNLSDLSKCTYWKKRSAPTVSSSAPLFLPSGETGLLKRALIMVPGIPNSSEQDDRHTPAVLVRQAIKAGAEKACVEASRRKVNSFASALIGTGAAGLEPHESVTALFTGYLAAASEHICPRAITLVLYTSASKMPSKGCIVRGTELFDQVQVIREACQHAVQELLVPERKNLLEWRNLLALAGGLLLVVGWLAANVRQAVFR